MSGSRLDGDYVDVMHARSEKFKGGAGIGHVNKSPVGLTGRIRDDRITVRRGVGNEKQVCFHGNSLDSVDRQLALPALSFAMQKLPHDMRKKRASFRKERKARRVRPDICSEHEKVQPEKNSGADRLFRDVALDGRDRWRLRATI